MSKAEVLHIYVLVVHRGKVIQHTAPRGLREGRAGGWRPQGPPAQPPSWGLEAPARSAPPPAHDELLQWARASSQPLLSPHPGPASEGDTPGSDLGTEKFSPLRWLWEEKGRLLAAAFLAGFSSLHALLSGLQGYQVPRSPLPYPWTPHTSDDSWTSLCPTRKRETRWRPRGKGPAKERMRAPAENVHSSTWWQLRESGRRRARARGRDGCRMEPPDPAPGLGHAPGMAGGFKVRSGAVEGSQGSHCRRVTLASLGGAPATSPEARVRLPAVSWSRC